MNVSDRTCEAVFKAAKDGATKDDLCYLANLSYRAVNYAVSQLVTRGRIECVGRSHWPYPRRGQPAKIYKSKVEHADSFQ